VADLRRFFNHYLIRLGEHYESFINLGKIFDITPCIPSVATWRASLKRARPIAEDCYPPLRRPRGSILRLSKCHRRAK
jgi:hypothetical protein